MQFFFRFVLSFCGLQIAWCAVQVKLFPKFWICLIEISTYQQPYSLSDHLKKKKGEKLCRVIMFNAIRTHQKYGSFFNCRQCVYALFDLTWNINIGLHFKHSVNMLFLGVWILWKLDHTKQSYFAELVLFIFHISPQGGGNMT